MGFSDHQASFQSDRSIVSGFNEECRGHAYPTEAVLLSPSLRTLLGVQDEVPHLAKRPGPTRRKRIFGEDESDGEAEEKMIDEMKRLNLRFDFDSGEDYDEHGETLDQIMLASLSKVRPVPRPILALTDLSEQTDFDVPKVVFYIFRDIFVSWGGDRMLVSSSPDPFSEGRRSERQQDGLVAL